MEHWKCTLLLKWQHSNSSAVCIHIASRLCCLSEASTVKIFKSAKRLFKTKGLKSREAVCVLNNGVSFQGFETSSHQVWHTFLSHIVKTLQVNHWAVQVWEMWPWICRWLSWCMRIGLCLWSFLLCLCHLHLWLLEKKLAVDFPRSMILH